MDESCEKLNTYVEAITKTFADKVQNALSQIKEPERRLLAIRGYLRTKRNIATDWAWNNQRADAFRKGICGQEVQRQINLVTSEFEAICAADHVGEPMTLKTAPKTRSLEKQIGLWNKYASVGIAGRRLWAMSLAEVQGPFYNPIPDKRPAASLESRDGTVSDWIYPAPTRLGSAAGQDRGPAFRDSRHQFPLDTPSFEDGVARFRRFLKRSSPGSITVATPGLSDHGHGNAIDFIVETKSGKVIASAVAADVKRVWDDGGWTKRLKRATIDSASKFEGPLASPYEPWHYVIHLKTDSCECPLTK